MTLCLKQSLAKLEKLSPQKLHQTNARIRAELGGAEWKMGLCLLATARTNGFRKLGYSNLTEYAEKALQLSGTMRRSSAKACALARRGPNRATIL